MNKEEIMAVALAEARLAEAHDDVPVGAVVSRNGEIIAVGHNMRESGNSPVAHAEIVALHRAGQKLNDWNLCECELFVTLEPCLMCCGAIINSRIRKLYFGAYDQRFGAVGSKYDFSVSELNHNFEVEGGVLQAECATLVSQFFQKKRKNKKSE